MRKCLEPYVSCIRVNGKPILPPVMDKNRRAEMQHYREMAINVSLAIEEKRRKKEASKENELNELSSVEEELFTELISTELPLTALSLELVQDVVGDLVVGDLSPTITESTDLNQFLDSTLETSPPSRNKIIDSEQPSRLVRSDSYTLDRPSSPLLAYVQRTSQSSVTVYSSASNTDLTARNINNVHKQSPFENIPINVSVKSINNVNPPNKSCSNNTVSPKRKKPKALVHVPSHKLYKIYGVRSKNVKKTWPCSKNIKTPVVSKKQEKQSAKTLQSCNLPNVDFSMDLPDDWNEVDLNIDLTNDIICAETCHVENSNIYCNDNNEEVEHFFPSPSPGKTTGSINQNGWSINTFQENDTFQDFSKPVSKNSEPKLTTSSNKSNFSPVLQLDNSELTTATMKSPELGRPATTQTDILSSDETDSQGQYISSNKTSEEESRPKSIIGQKLLEVASHIQAEYETTLTHMLKEQEREQLRLKQEFLRQQEDLVQKLAFSACESSRTLALSTLQRDVQKLTLAAQNDVSPPPSPPIRTSRSRAEASTLLIRKSLTPEVKRKLARLPALVRGHLVRRLMATERVQSIKATVRDTLTVAVHLHSLPPPLHHSDIALHGRLIQQLDRALMELHDLFFAMPVAARMALIAVDRERKRRGASSARSLDGGSSGGRLSSATQRRQQQRQERLTKSQTTPRTSRPRLDQSQLSQSFHQYVLPGVGVGHHLQDKTEAAGARAQRMEKRAIQAKNKRPWR